MGQNQEYNADKIQRLKNVIISQAISEEMTQGELMRALFELTLEKAFEFGFDKCENHYRGISLIIDKEEFINTDARVTRVQYEK